LMLKSIPLAAAAALLLAQGAAAAISAATTTDLNVRTGPGPEFGVIHVIATNTPVIIEGCMVGSKWCMVDADGVRGWAYSDYLSTTLAGTPVIVGSNVVALGLSTAYTAQFAAAPASVVTYGSVAAPVVTYGATADTVIIADDSAAQLAAARAYGSTFGAASPRPVVTLGSVAAPVATYEAAPVVTYSSVAAPALVEPPLFVRTYLVRSPRPSMAVAGQVLVGATLPATVQLYDVPAYQYDYAYVNGVAVLVDPATRQILYIGA